MTKKFYLLFTCLIACLFSLKAQTPLAGSTPENPVSLQEGEEYLLPTDFSTAYFTFTSDKDGVLYLQMSSSLQMFLVNSSGENINPLPIFDNSCVQGVRAGETYMFNNASTWGKSVTMQVTFKEGAPYLPIALEEVTPAESSVYHPTNKEGQVSFRFNVEVNASAIQASLVLNDGERVTLSDYFTSEDYTTRGTIYTLNVADTYSSLINSGRLNAGENFKIVLTDIADKENPENIIEEEVSVTYTAGSKTVTLTGSNKEGYLNAYYLEGDEEGLITLTFSGNVTCKAKTASLAYGDREAGTWMEIAVPYSIEENTITLDIQGLHLNKAPLDDNGERIVNISLKGICDTDGNYIESNTVGSPGTIYFAYKVNTIEVNIYCDFMPALNSYIDETKEIEIWIAEGKYITFDSAKLTFLRGGETVELRIPYSQLRIEDDPYSEKDLLVYVPLTDCYPEAGEVTVELTNVLAANGSSPVIKGTFKSAGTKAEGISHIQAGDTQSLHIYTLKGEQVGRIETATDLNSLPAGIYLVKGKKVIVK